MVHKCAFPLSLLSTMLRKRKSERIARNEIDRNTLSGNAKLRAVLLFEGPVWLVKDILLVLYEYLKHSFDPPSIRRLQVITTSHSDARSLVAFPYLLRVFKDRNATGIEAFDLRNGKPCAESFPLVVQGRIFDSCVCNTKLILCYRSYCLVISIPTFQLIRKILFPCDYLSLLLPLTSRDLIVVVNTTMTEHREFTHLYALLNTEEGMFHEQPFAEAGRYPDLTQSADGNTAFTTYHWDTEVKMWNLDTTKPSLHLISTHRHPERKEIVRALSLSETRLAVHVADGKQKNYLQIWDLKSNQLTRRVRCGSIDSMGQIDDDWFFTIEKNRLCLRDTIVGAAHRTITCSCTRIVEVDVFQPSSATAMPGLKQLAISQSDKKVRIFGHTTTSAAKRCRRKATQKMDLVQGGKQLVAPCRDQHQTSFKAL